MQNDAGLAYALRDNRFVLAVVKVS